MRRRKLNGTTPVAFYNLGSSAAEQIDLQREILYTRMDDRIAQLAVQIPVFFVNEAQMDSLTPPHLTRGLNKRGVESLLREYMQQERKTDRESEQPSRESSPIKDAWDEIQRRIEEATDEPLSGFCWRKFAAMGLYFGRHSRKPNLQNFAYGNPPVNQDSYQVFQATELPVIFICPERVLNSANSLQIDPQLLFDKVLYHELGHAYMDRGSSPSEHVYNTAWGRVIEESLANWIAFSQFNKTEARYVQRFIANQPAEYQGYLTVNRLQVFPFGEEWRYYADIEEWLRERVPGFYWAAEFFTFVHDFLNRFYHRHLLRGEWFELYNFSGDANRLMLWSRFKRERQSLSGSVDPREERFWQLLAAQIILET